MGLLDCRSRSVKQQLTEQIAFRLWHEQELKTRKKLFYVCMQQNNHEKEADNSDGDDNVVPGIWTDLRSFGDLGFVLALISS